MNFNPIVYGEEINGEGSQRIYDDAFAAEGPGVGVAVQPPWMAVNLQRCTEAAQAELMAI